MRIQIKWVFTLTVLVAACAACLPSYARDYDVSDLEGPDLVPIVADPVKQRMERMLVQAAISALGDFGYDAAAVKVLVDNIGYPFVAAPLPAGSERLPNPIVLSPRGNGYGYRIKEFYCAQALVRIGDSCVLAVLRKLRDSDNPHERNACLDVLLELKERAEVLTMLEQTLNSAETPAEQHRLQSALNIAPYLDRRLVSSRERPELTPEMVIMESRRSLLSTSVKFESVNMSPVVVVDGRRSLGKAVTIDEVGFTSVRQLARLMHFQSRMETNALALTTSGPDAKELTVQIVEVLATPGSTPLGIQAIRRGKDVLVPVQAVAEHFGARVRWDPAYRAFWVETSVKGTK